jgi:hypothetical protein
MRQPMLACSLCRSVASQRPNPLRRPETVPTEPSGDSNLTVWRRRSTGVVVRDELSSSHETISIGDCSKDAVNRELPWPPGDSRILGTLHRASGPLRSFRACRCSARKSSTVRSAFTARPSSGTTRDRLSPSACEHQGGGWVAFVSAPDPSALKRIMAPFGCDLRALDVEIDYGTVDEALATWGSAYGEEAIDRLLDGQSPKVTVGLGIWFRRA